MSAFATNGKRERNNTLLLLCVLLFTQEKHIVQLRGIGSEAKEKQKGIIGLEGGRTSWYLIHILAPHEHTAIVCSNTLL